MNRLYVDEVGNHHLTSANAPNNRYLGLTGVALTVPAAKFVLYPSMQTLKVKHFGPEKAKTMVLHRKDLVNKNAPFEALRDAKAEESFNEDLLSLLSTVPYVVITVVIDKLQHREQYKVWHHHPYHYCMQTLVERYCMWLSDRGERGDVVTEARGKREDGLLTDSFARIVKHGTDVMPAESFEDRLSDHALKVVPKVRNLPGLQLADLVASPSAKAMIHVHARGPEPTAFAKRIVAILEQSKYRRNRYGQIDGYGRKWLP
jgi:hypothetical protein